MNATERKEFAIEVRDLVIGALNPRFDRIDDRFELIDDRFVSIDQRFESIDERFDKMDRRFDKMDQRFDTLEKRFDRLEDKVSANSADIIILKTEMLTAFDAIALLINKHFTIEAHEKRISTLETNVMLLNKTVFPTK